MLFDTVVRDNYVNEKITVCVGIKNPLQIQIKLENIQLCCQYTNTYEDIQLQQEVELDAQDSDSEFLLEKKDLTIKENENINLSLSVTPYKKGKMIIKGLRWNYLDAEGHHDFQFLGKPLLKPKDG